MCQVGCWVGGSSCLRWHSVSLTYRVGCWVGGMGQLLPPIARVVVSQVPRVRIEHLMALQKKQTLV